MLRSNRVWLACVLAIGGAACAAGPDFDVQGQETGLRSDEAAAVNNGDQATNTYAFGTVIGSGRRIDEERMLPQFARVEASTGVTVDIAIGEQRIVVSADDNVVPYIRTHVSNDVLIIDVDTSTSVSSTTPLGVKVTVPQLKSASAGVGVVLSVKDIVGAELSLTADTGSKVQASGAIDHLKATATVGGELSARDLKAKKVELSANIGGTLRVTASEEVSGSLDFGSIAYVSGHPPRQTISVALGSILTFD